MMQTTMLALIKRRIFLIIIILILFCCPVFLFSKFVGKTQSIDLSTKGNKLTPPLISPKVNPVISPSLERFLTLCSPEDSVKIWVFFTDKGIFAQNQYEEAKLTCKNSFNSSALKRRLKNRVGIDFLDLPVNQNYIDEILGFGGTLRQKSRWLNAASFLIQVDKIEKIAQLSFAREIKKVASFRRKPAEITKTEDELYRLKGFFGYGRNYGPSLPQLDQINVPIVHDMGYKGQSVIVCMMDTGFRKNHQVFTSAFSESRVLAEYDFINHDTNTQNQLGDPPDQHDHGTFTWSALGGEYDGQLYGPAYKANFVLAKTEDVSQEIQIEEDNWVAGIEWADSNGAEVVSSSLGYSTWDDGTGYTYQDMDGNTTLCTQAADLAASKGIVVVNAAGNEALLPWHYIIAPADGDSVIAVGAVDMEGVIADFSSVGPTYDGRIKPEVVARGVFNYCADPYNIIGYTQVSGTSLSTPLVGGCAAVLLSAHPDWTAMQTRDALMMTANNSSSPNNTYGWGLVDLFAALNYAPSGALAIQHDPPLFTSDTLNPYIMRATITPENGLNEDSLFLFWRSDTLSPFVKQNLQSLGSDQYQAEIPPQNAGTILYYYFSAQDSLGNVVNFPLGAPRFKFMFYVATDFITFDFEDGLYHWETGGVNNSWNWTSVSSHGGIFSFTDSPQGGYKNNTDSWTGIKEAFDLTGAETPQLSFWHRFQFWSGDTGFVEINTDKCKGWERISSPFVESQTTWTQVNLPLGLYLGYANVKFRFHLTSDGTGTADGWYIDDVQFNFQPTAVEEEVTSSAPVQFSLLQNHPNPFNSATTIPFTVSSSQPIAPSPMKAVHSSQFMVHSPLLPTTLRIYNILGQKVRTLVDESKEAGNYEVIWDGKNDKGEEVASGIYFYQLVTENNRVTRKMVLLK
jgi:serine protease AprX